MSSKNNLEEFKFDSEILSVVNKKIDERIERYKKTGKVTDIETGFEQLDAAINGLEPVLHVLGGAPRMGKTTFGKQLADQVVKKHKIPVIVVCYEQGTFKLLVKSYSRLGKIDSLHFRRGTIAEGEKKRLEEAKEKYRKEYAPYLVTIHGSRQTTVTKIESYARAAMKKHHTNKCLIIVDYLQKVPPRDASSGDKRANIDEVLTDLADLAVELDCPIWLFSSFARKAYEKRAGEPLPDPDITAFKESGNIEYSATVAIVVKLVGTNNDAPRRTICFDIVKNSDGQPTKINFDFRPALSVFGESENQNTGRSGNVTNKC